MQVPSFKYVVPRVLVVICAKFGKFPRTDPWVINHFACKVAQDRTYLALLIALHLKLSITH
jgi:hypothetical protein